MKLSAKKRNIVVKFFLVVLTSFLFVTIFFQIFTASDASKPLNPNNSALITALNNYYGEWKIVEDFGYHGVHRTVEIDVFEVGKIIIFNKNIFCYEDTIKVLYPSIVIELVTSPDIQQIDRISDPGAMGFTINDVNQYYAKVYVKNRAGDNIFMFYILNDTEIILEGDIHRYYRAVKVDK